MTPARQATEPPSAVCQGGATAAAPVMYKLGVVAVVTGQLSGTGIAVRLVVAVAAGVAIGLVAGVLTRLALAALHDAAAETTVIVAAPFAVYLLAESVQGSGVLAVLTLGLFLRSCSHTAITSGGWLLGARCGGLPTT